MKSNWWCSWWIGGGDIMVGIWIWFLYSLVLSLLKGKYWSSKLFDLFDLLRPWPLTVDLQNLISSWPWPHASFLKRAFKSKTLFWDIVQTNFLWTWSVTDDLENVINSWPWLHVSFLKRAFKSKHPFLSYHGNKLLCYIRTYRHRLPFVKLSFSTAKNVVF